MNHSRDTDHLNLTYCILISECFEQKLLNIFIRRGKTRFLTTVLLFGVFTVSQIRISFPGRSKNKARVDSSTEHNKKTRTQN